MEIKIDESNVNKRFDTIIADVSRSKLSAAIEKGIIKVNGKMQKPSYKLKLNDIVIYDENDLYSFLNTNTELLPYDFKLDIKYEDDDIVIINKPKGILTHKTAHENLKTISNALLFKYGKNLSDLSGKDRLGIVHRLDKNTSGLMIACKNNRAHKNISNQIKEKVLRRKYKAIALGEFEVLEGIIDKPLVHYFNDDVKMKISSEGGLEAITKYKVVEEFKGASLVELELKTGRTHQIRVHLSSIGHPVFGDSLYGAKSYMRSEFYNLKTVEQLLQSYYISFIHPLSGENMEFQLNEDEYSEDFIKVLNFLRRNNVKY